MAPIELIDDDEQLEYETDGTVFYYKRLHGTTRKRIIKRHTPRVGEPDLIAALYDMIRECIIKTKNLQMKGVVVDWEPRFAERLPDKQLGDLAELIGANIEREEREAKNSLTSSDSNTTTTE